MGDRLNIEILPAPQKKLLDLISGKEWIKDFYLAGGTALALQIGHRRSVDFDLFTSNRIDTKRIASKASGCGSFELFSEDNDTLHGSLNGVKVSFFSVKERTIGKEKRYKKLRLAPVLDIALMKLNAISGRGSKKDFIDLSFVLRIYQLNDLLKSYERKYGVSAANNYHLLKSLLFFEDAEDEPMPNMVIKRSWKSVKKEILSAVKGAGII